MKILFIAPYFYPHKGGLEQYCLEVVKRLALKNKVIVVTSDIQLRKEQKKNFAIIRLEGWNLLKGRFPLPKLKFKNIRALREIFQKKTKPDVVITNTRFFPINLLVVRFAKKNKIKTIHIEHGTCHPEMESLFKSFLARIYDEIFGRYVILSADKVIGISKAAADFAKKLGARNTEVIYNSVDINFFSPSRVREKNKFLEIVFVGRLIYAKGVQDLISVFKAIKNKKLLLNIVGSGFYEESLKKIAQNDKRIKFWGERNQGEIKEILDRSHIFINPSYSEGLPTSVLEAGAMGLAVIATDVGGTKEIIDDGENGFLFKAKNKKALKEKLIYLARNRIARKQMGDRLRKKIEEKFAWEKNIARIIKIVRSCEK